MKNNRGTIVVGALMALFSIVMVGGFINDIIQPDMEDIGISIGLGIFFSLTTVAGIVLFFNGIRNWRRGELVKFENILLQQIEHYGGKVTPEMIALNTNLTSDEARKALDRMVEKGSAEIQVTDQGRLVYVFWGFVNKDDLQSAKNPLDL